MDRDQLLRLAARGALAGAVGAELAAPLARVATVLEAMVERLDRHVATARGPEPLPYAALGEVRERMAEAFLDLGRLARLAADLSAVAATTAEAAPLSADVNDLVERALSLARHRFDPDCDVDLDLGSLPLTRVDTVRVVQVLAHLLVEAAIATGPGATVAVHTSNAHGEVRVQLSYPGARPAPAPFADLIDADLAAEGGRLTYTVNDQRTVAVLLLPLRK